MSTATAPQRAASLGDGRASTQQVLGSVGVAAAALALWQVASLLTFVIPPPLETLRVLFANLAEPGYRAHLSATAGAVAVSFVIGTVVGGLLGLLLGMSHTARLALEPLVIALNGVPKIVLYPILLTMFQLSGAKVAMAILFSLFPVLINVATGVRELPAVYWKLGRSVGASRWQMLAHVILPGIRRPLLTGLRLAISLAVVGVVLSEFFATRQGLGRVVLQAYGHGDYASMVATIMLLITASFVLSILLWRWEKRIR